MQVIQDKPVRAMNTQETGSGVYIYINNNNNIYLYVILHSNGRMHILKILKGKDRRYSAVQVCSINMA